MKYVGIDYRKRCSVVCIIDETGWIVAEERIAHAFPARFAQLLGAHTPCQMALEATMNWGWLRPSSPLSQYRFHIRFICR